MSAVQRAAEAATAAVIDYLRSTDTPTAELAQATIRAVLTDHQCDSPEGLIVAGGLMSAEPHERGSGQLVPGTPIVIDIYPQSTATGWFADMTRTVCIGEPPSELQKRYNAVAEAQRRAIAMVAPGVRCLDIQNAVEEYFLHAGYQTTGRGTEFQFAEGFVHGVGHGVGKAIHEHPHLTRQSPDVLEVGDVITIEPGLYYRDIGGVRLEDMLYVTETGHHNLTTFPKVLEI